ncbi:MAG: LexA family transcriptional regulator [Bacteroidales bacterium]|nr:LexA family transcriptional regulator [Bacteroidales bacterium]
MNFSTNIKLLRKRKGRTQDDVAFALGMKRSTLSGYENEISQPTVQALIAFSRYFGIAVDTLLKVDLHSLSESQLSQLERGGDVYLKGSNIRILATTVNSANDDNIELVSEKAKAGYTTGFADPGYIRDLPVFHLPFLSKQKKYRTFQLNGDSMLPIPDGSYVTGEFVQDWNTIVSGHGYIILTMDDGIVFKIAENLLNTDHKLRLYSLNPMYEPFDTHVNEIKEVWKFVNYISSEIPDPVIPQDELIKTVTSLKKDVNLLKRRYLKDEIRNRLG